MKVGLKYTLVQNRTRYEKFAGHMPPKRRETREPFYDNNLKLFKWCMLLGCDVTSKRKSNIKGHMNNCDTQKKRASTKTCPYCKATFTQKYHWDRHIKKIHQDDIVTFLESVTKTIEITNESEDNKNEKMMIGSFVYENGEVIDLNNSVIDKDTPIYQVLESGELAKWISRQENLESTSIDLDETEQQINDTIQIEQNNSADCLSNTIIKEITQKKKEKSKCYEEDFRILIIKKLKQDLKIQ